MSRKAAAQLWHKARRWDRETRRKGKHGGIIGRTALTVYYVLLFDFLNYTSGRLDPSLDRIAERAGCCRRAVVTSLAKLRDLGLLNWVRRCEEDRDQGGRFRLRQRTNAYSLSPSPQWRGYRDNTPPLPHPDTLGAPLPVPYPIAAAAAEVVHGQYKAALAALEADPRNALALALVGLGRAIEAREIAVLPRVHKPPRNNTLSSDHTGADRVAAPQPADNDFEALKRWHLQRLLSTDRPD
jgi:hypothetical protein